MLGESEMLPDIGPCDLVDVVRANTAKNAEKALSLLLGALVGDRLPAVGGAVIRGNGGDDHELVLAELRLSCPDSVPSESNHPHFLTID